MNVEVTRELAAAVGWKEIAAYGVTQEGLRWNSTTINLRRVNNSGARALLKLCDTAAVKKLKGGPSLIRDLKVWCDAARYGATAVKCKNPKHFEALAREAIKVLPGQRLYEREPLRDVWRCAHVGKIDYYPTKRTSYGVVPAHTDISLYWLELGQRKRERLSFDMGDCKGRTVFEVLQTAGWLPENADLLEEYDALKAKYVECHDKVGRQYLADGIGTDDLDGNPVSDSNNWWRQTKEIVMPKAGEPARVVIDVRFESDEKPEREDSDGFNANYWGTDSLLEEADDKDDDDIEPDECDPDNDDDDDEAVESSLDKLLPLYPVVPVFDLKRHLRLRVHVGNLVAYSYDPNLGNQLILPDEERKLIDLLVAHAGGFKDVVGGKGGGSIILCAGPPGTGKTLTSEVYAEVMAKPLYSVQCSQLGVTPEELENELLKAFGRATRWGAIMLLDEADVYVSQRGSDLQQNAIVGVFLRVLEYYGGVLFLTTNRPELVDDAVASRCLARILYRPPSVPNQVKIWNQMAQRNGVDLPAKVAEAFAHAHPGTTGRDVKNLLKLVSLVARGQKVTEAMLELAKRFKPTTDEVVVERKAALKEARS